MIFRNRHDAGKQLAKKLGSYKNKKDVIVLGIPRGGVEVAFQLAKILHSELSIVVTKKIGHPFNPEFAIGAVSPGNYVIDEEYEDSEDYVKRTVRKINAGIKKRYRNYTKGKLPQLKDKIVIVADDGLATGHTMLAAIKYVKSKSPKKVIAAVPVAASDSLEKVKQLADKVVCLHVPIYFGAVSSFYREFEQLEDEEVKNYLKEAKK